MKVLQKVLHYLSRSHETIGSLEGLLRFRVIQTADHGQQIVVAYTDAEAATAAGPLMLGLTQQLECALEQEAIGTLGGVLVSF